MKVIAITCALLVALGLLLAQTDPYRALFAFSTDTSLYLRSLLNAETTEPPSSEVVIVAIDEQTYRTPPFNEFPRVMWTPQLAELQDRILGAGAAVVGYDMIFPTSLAKLKELRGYEIGFLKSLKYWGSQGKIVLGQAEHANEPILPNPMQRMMVGGHNIRSLNLTADSDEVVRRATLYLRDDRDRPVPGFATELAMRAHPKELNLSESGEVRVGQQTIPGSASKQTYLNFTRGAEIPIYSLADLYSCPKTEPDQFFEQHFKDKIVLLGFVLDIEDRKVSSKRLFAKESDFVPASRCVESAALPANSDFQRDAIPGVYIHAKTVDSLLRNNFVAPLDSRVESVLIALTVGLCALCGFARRPLAGAAGFTVITLLLLVLDQLLLTQNTLMPALAMLSLALPAYIGALSVQYLRTYRKQAKTRHLFEHYLDPTVIEEMLGTSEGPALGGEKREITIWFSDVADFTAISEQLSPTELVSMMNRYFSVVTRMIEEHGGFVDKYIGDAVVGVFGAPLNDPYHAGHAVSCALLVQKKLAELNQAQYFGDCNLQTRIGLNTGEALVGNIGSDTRFNYTVMGDEVNLASRLEGVNKVFNTQILVSETTASRLPTSMVVRKLAALRVKGKANPISVYEPIDMRSWNKPVFNNPKAKQRGIAARSLNSGRVVSDQFAASRKCAEDFDAIYEAIKACRFVEARAILHRYRNDPVYSSMDRLIFDKESEYREFPESYTPITNLSSK